MSGNCIDRQAEQAASSTLSDQEEQPASSSSSENPPKINVMTDVAHELGALRMIVDSPLSSKVALFNNVTKSHMLSQSVNPFSESQGARGMQRLQISKEEYGRPKAGSLTEYRGKKANIQVYQEMLELCTVIHDEGQPVSKKDPERRVLLFGELFNIYTHINDKLVGLMLRARKHELIQFEGEMLFQRRDDNVPVFLVKPLREIREILVGKQTEIRRSLSPNPQPTGML